MKLSTKYFIFLSGITLAFCLAIGVDVSPYLRGPAPYPPEWQWSYLFVNTFSKIYVPMIFLILLGVFFVIAETKNIFDKKPKTFLLLLIFIGFLIQMSLLFFSRSGITVLLHRIINPDLNSYFTASLLIHDPTDFIKNYEQEMQQFVYHARSHPPGAIFIFYYIKQCIAPFTSFINFINNFHPSHLDVEQIWKNLLPIDRATAVFSAFFLPLLTSSIIIPLFYVGKIIYGIKIATRSIFLFTLLPTILFFIPINDTFLPLFSITAFLFLLKGLQKNSLLFFLLSGIILFIGVSFNLALLPLLLFFFLFAILYLRQNKFSIKQYIKGGMIFTIGLLLIPSILFLCFNFNFLRLIQLIFVEVPHLHSRSYITWLFYNIYDFFVFAGIPVAFLFIAQIKNFYKKDILFLSFFIFLIIVDFSGSTRGETGRIWAPYVPFFLLPTVAFVSHRLKFSTKLFVGVLLLQAIQILVMQEFWVMLW